MVQTQNIALKKYTKMGVIASVVIAVALIGIFAISGFNKGSDTETAMQEVSERAANTANLRIAVINMEKIQAEAKALENLHKQRASFEEKLKSKLEKEQKAIEKEKAEIEKSQDILSQEALQRRVVDYQRRVANFQKQITEGAQSIEASYQEALNTIQKKHLDPIIEGTLAKKKLSLVIDGRMVRVGEGAEDLDITDEVIKALDKKITSVKMEKPKGL